MEIRLAVATDELEVCRLWTMLLAGCMKNLALAPILFITSFPSVE